MTEIEAFPTHILEMAGKMNVPESFLEPEVYLFDQLSLRREMHEALVDITVVNPESILDKDELYRDFSASLDNNNFTFMGLDHTSFRAHEFVAKMIAEVDTANTAIAIEFPLRLQQKIDHFLSTGVFADGEDQKKYTQLYKLMQRSSAASDMPQDLSGTVFDEDLHLLQIYPILLVARAKNVDVHCFDPSDNPERSQESENMMYNELQKHMEKHIIVVVGANHTRSKPYFEEGDPIIPVRQLCAQSGLKTRSYFFDSHQDTKYEWEQDEDRVYETVMHSALSKKAEKIEKKGRLIGYNAQEISSITGNDVYVAVT